VVNARLQQYPAVYVRKRPSFADDINKNDADVKDQHAIGFLSEMRDLYDAEVDDHGPSSSSDDRIAVVGRAVAEAAHIISEVKLERTIHYSNESNGKESPDSDSNGGRGGRDGDSNNSGSNSSNVAGVAV
jgi:hypothetical protein